MVPLIETAVDLYALTLLGRVDSDARSRILGVYNNVFCWSLGALGKKHPSWVSLRWSSSLFWGASWLRLGIAMFLQDLAEDMPVTFFFLLWWKAIWLFLIILNGHLLNRSWILSSSNRIQLLLSLRESFLPIRENCVSSAGVGFWCVFFSCPLNSSLMLYYCITTHFQFFWGGCG